MGASISTSSSEQSAQVNLAQQFAGTCNLECQNIMDNTNITLINDIIGGNVDITQTCSTNGSCMIGSTMNAASDVYFKAANSTAANNAAGLFPWSINYDSANSSSRQDISQQMQQGSSENCNIGSYNSLDNVSIFAENSTIGGNVEVSQAGSTQGQCQLTNSMSAAAYATGMADNTAQSGKAKKGSFGLSTGLMIGIGVIIAIIVVIIAFVIGKEVMRHVESQYGKPDGVSSSIPPREITQTLA